MIKITPKSKTPDLKYKQGYELMQAAFSELVFCGNLGGRVPTGTDYVLVDTSDVEAVRKAIVDIWMACEGIEFSPDEILEIEFVYGRL